MGDEGVEGGCGEPAVGKRRKGRRREYVEYGESGMGTHFRLRS